MRLCLNCIRRSKEGALHIIAICCNSFCRPAINTHGRNILFPEGNCGYEFVSIGNKLASRMTLVMYYSLYMRARFLLEQPHHSALSLHPRMSYLMDHYNVWRTAIWGGYFADSPETATPKRHWFYSPDFQLLDRMQTEAGHMSKPELAELTGARLVKKRKTSDGNSNWSGDKELMKKSQLLGSIFATAIC